jgi:3-oxoacyl-[acyl-carrier protein] reductase
MRDFAVVTGGARNIGGAIAARLKADGFGVVVLDRENPAHGDFDDFARVDLSDVGATKAALSKIVEGRRCTRLVNNAGIVMPASLEETDPASMDEVAAVNLRAPIVCAQALLPSMKSAGIGRIVNISSRVALGKELRTVYAATKAGLHGMTKTWALELGRFGITVNSIGPGPVRTSLFDQVNPPGSPRTKAIVERVPVGFLGEPADVADAVSFFVSDRARFVTGQVLYVCGGMTIGSA